MIFNIKNIATMSLERKLPETKPDFSNIRPTRNKKPIEEIRVIIAKEDAKLQARLDAIDEEYPPATSELLNTHLD